MTVNLSSPESGTGSTDSGTRGEDEGMCELSQVRGVRRGPSPDQQRGNEYVRALVHRDSIPGPRKHTYLLIPPVYDLKINCFRK